MHNPNSTTSSESYVSIFLLAVVLCISSWIAFSVLVLEPSQERAAIHINKD